MTAPLPSTISAPAVMSLQERSDLVLTFARVLHVNGQSTDETLAAAERLGNKLDLRARIIPGWGELHLQAEDGSAGMISIGAADPIGVDMDRVASAMRAIDEISAGRLAPPAAKEAISAISHAPRSEEHTSELQSLRHLVC